MIQTKPNRCKHCKKRLPTDMARHVLHPKCIDPWVAIQREKQAKARIKAEKVRQVKDRRETKAKLEAFKGRGYWIAQAQTAFNAFIRARDAGLPCICCGRTAAGDVHGGTWDAGHYRSRGSAPHLRFDERNCHAQLKQCNRYDSGNVVGYRLGLIARIGLEAVAALEADQEPRKWSIDDLKQIKADYTARVRALKARQA